MGAGRSQVQILSPRLTESPVIIGAFVVLGVHPGSSAGSSHGPHSVSCLGPAAAGYSARMPPADNEPTQKLIGRIPVDSAQIVLLDPVNFQDNGEATYQRVVDASIAR